MLKSTNCSDCLEERLDVSSSTFTDLGYDDSVTYLDGTSLRGDVSTERICVTTDLASCATAQAFVALTQADGLSDYEDGILGLWSGNRDGYNDFEMLMPGLYDDDVISEQTFSFYLTGLSGTSYIDFGPIDTSLVTDTDQILWMDIIDDDYWWTQKVTGFRWDGDETEYAIYEMNGTTDTGSSCLIGPSAYIDLV